MSTASRFTSGPGQDKTLRTVTQDYQNPDYAATLNLAPTEEKTRVNVKTLTGALTINIAVGSATTAPYVGDEIEILLTADTTARVVTFGTGFTSNGALTIPISSSAVISFKFNGVSWLQTQVGNSRDVVDIQTPAYSTPIAITTTKKTTKVIPAQLTGALTLTAVTTGAVAGDILIFAFSADGTNRVVTFSTNLTSAGTLTIVASKFGSTSFIYNGSTWIETGRALTA